MSERVHLPSELRTQPFAVATALQLGLGRKRLRHPGLSNPFYGVRVAGTVSTLAQRAEAYRARQTAHQAVCALAAAACWGLPVPHNLQHGPVEVLVPWGCTPPRAKGVRGRRIRPELWRAVQLQRLAVTPPPLTFVTLAGSCELEHLVVIGDAMITDADNYPGLAQRPQMPRSEGVRIETVQPPVSGRGPLMRTSQDVRIETMQPSVSGQGPLTSLDELHEAVAVFGRGPGAPVLRTALALLRPGVESPMESLLRFVLVAAGVPEPEINPTIRLRSGRLVRGDLVDQDARLFIEYDGDQHWQDRQQYQRDLQRTRELQDDGWRVVRVTTDDLRHEHRPALVERIRNALTAA